MFRERAYRSSLLVLGLILTAVFLAAIPFIVGPLGRYASVPGFWTGLGAIFVGMWVVVALACRAFPTYAGPHGLRAYNGAGVYYDVPWSAMRSVRRVPGYYLVRHGRWGSALSVPTFLTGQAEFEAYVREHAPEGNPLRRALEPR